MVKKWTEEELQFLRDNYNKMETRRIAGMLGRTIEAITLKANRIGLQKDHYSYNVNYFDKIDSSTKAYWLGFIMADGCISIQDTGHYLTIELSSKDESHISNFLNDISSNAKIRRRTRTLNKTGGEKTYEMVSTRVFSSDFVDSLVSHGAVPRKTYDMSFGVGVPDEFLCDYVRGYFDGDGSVSLSHVKRPGGRVDEYLRVTFVCYDESFLKKLQSVLKEKEIESTIYKDRGYFVLFIRRLDSVRSFFNYIYRDGEQRFLARKHNVFVSFYNQHCPHAQECA